MNRLTATTGSGGSSYTHDAANEVERKHDNPLTGGGRTMTWDSQNRMASGPKFDLYGVVRANGGTASSRQGFVGGLGHVSDTETGLIYMRARYYDPNVGRFNSEDSAGHGSNWFAYCDNDPVNEVDADGKIGTTATAWVLSIVTDWTAAAIGYVLAEACVLTAIHSASVAGNLSAVALGFAAAYCFAVATGGTPGQALYGALLTLAGVLTATINSAGLGGKAATAAGGFATAAVTAVAVYAIMIVGALAVDLLE